MTSYPSGPSLLHGAKAPSETPRPRTATRTATYPAAANVSARLLCNDPVLPYGVRSTTAGAGTSPGSVTSAANVTPSRIGTRWLKRRVRWGMRRTLRRATRPRTVRLDNSRPGRSLLRTRLGRGPLPRIPQGGAAAKEGTTMAGSRCVTALVALGMLAAGCGTTVSGSEAARSTGLGTTGNGLSVPNGSGVPGAAPGPAAALTPSAGQPAGATTGGSSGPAKTTGTRGVVRGPAVTGNP